MSARIFIHPRCSDGPASGALAAHLQGQGFDMQKVIAFYEVRPGKGPRFELVRRITESGVNEILERMDGTRFQHRLGEILDAPPEAA